MIVRPMILAAGLALGASLAASTALFAQETTMVRSIDVNVELDDVDANALEYWPDIAADLATALEARSMPFRAEDGVDISVQLEEISLSGSRILTGEGEFNHLEGWVYFREAGEEVPFEQEEIVLDATTLHAGVSPEGITVPGRPVFYSALVDAFAIATLERLQGEDPASIDENRKAEAGEEGGAGN